MKPHKVFDCAIIGGGPAGLSAALYLLRFQRKVVVFTHGDPRVTWAPRIHNLIGYPKGISGKSLLHHIDEQFHSYKKFKCIQAEVSVKKAKGGFEITDGKTQYFARKVILATGITDNQPNLKNLKTLRRKGLLRYCSICDGYEMTKQPIAVLANDDMGIQKALFIGTWTSKIKIIMPKSYKISAKRLSQIESLGMEVIPCDSITVTETKEQAKRGVIVRVDDRRKFYAKVIYVELGCEVNSKAFAGLHGLRKSKEGFLITTTEQKTSIKGLYAVGDCVNRLGQVSVGLGEAAIAASSVHEALA